jgi:hypothetical protein
LPWEATLWNANKKAAAERWIRAAMTSRFPIDTERGACAGTSAIGRMKSHSANFFGPVAE